jgi:glutamine synthetase
MPTDSDITIESLPELLKNDSSVKVAGVDVDGVLRGKLMAKKKFLSIANDGFGFCSVVFGWDMHDQTYFRELKISNKENGYRDLIAVPDLKSFRRIPWENDVPFFLLSFLEPDTRESLSACPRSLLKRAVKKIEKEGYKAMAGGKYRQISISLDKAMDFTSDRANNAQRNTNFTSSVLHKVRVPNVIRPQQQHS